jgi:hypothetical protein
MRDLFGREASAPARVRRSRTRAATAAVPRRATTKPEPVAGQAFELPSAVGSFISLGASVCLSSEATGTVWLVPDYTAEARPEISATDLSRLLEVLRMFPGARVARFDMYTPASTSTGAPASTETRSA